VISRRGIVRRSLYRSATRTRDSRDYPPLIRPCTDGRDAIGRFAARNLGKTVSSLYNWERASGFTLQFPPISRIIVSHVRISVYLYIFIHTHIHTHIYIYMCVCVCVCVERRALRCSAESFGIVGRGTGGGAAAAIAVVFERRGRRRAPPRRAVNPRGSR